MGLDGSATPNVLLGGGIGAGKSSVAEVFAERGFRVIDADEIGAEVLRQGSDAAKAVAERWPDTVRGGVVDRRALAQIVFASNSELRHLEAITHPAIAAEILRRIDESSRPVIVEVPLLHLVLPGDWCQAAVIADESIRIVRAVERGGDPGDIRRRVSSQVSDDEWTEWADIVIDNSGSWEGTRNQVDTVIDELDA